jgi:uncharacterized protein (TIGR03000 family)
MYSVILMAAMTTNTAEAPAFHKQRAFSCYGGMVLWSGGYGSCMGCWGAGYGSGYGGGCWGSCYGGGGWGAGYCGTGFGGGGCYGCMGCYGSWFGYGDYTTPGAVTYPGMNPMTTPAAPTAPTTPAKPAEPGTPPAATPPPTGTGTPPPGTGAARPMGARLIIEKPADAKLFVDDRPVKCNAARETFSTPGLDPAQAYYYMVRVEMVRDGRPVSETRRVIVRAGETVQETFAASPIVTASLKSSAGR